MAAPSRRSPTSEEADRVRTSYYFPCTVFVHRRRYCACPRYRDARARGHRGVHRLVPVGRPAVPPLYCYQLLAVRGGDARERASPVRPVRDRAAAIFGGSAQVEEWEIAVLHRDHRSGEGACVRATWVKVDPDQIDRGIDFYKATILPALEELEGFCSASLLVDRASGRAVASATYNSVETMERNRDQLDRLRATGSPDAGAQVLDERDFELAIAHLRVPEMA